MQLLTDGTYQARKFRLLLILPCSNLAGVVTSSDRGLRCQKQELAKPIGNQKTKPIGNQKIAEIEFT